jgi:hypothetical protein
MIVFSYGDRVNLFETFSFIATLGHLVSVIVIITGFSLSLKCVNLYLPKEIK